MRKIIRYWWRVIKRSVKKSWDLLKAHLLVGIILILSIFLITYLSTKGLLNGTFIKDYVGDIESWFRLIFPILIIAMIWFLVNLIIQPARIYEEMGGFDDLKLRINIECPPPRYSEKWLSIKIYNDHSYKTIHNCLVYLDSVISLEDNSSPLKRQGEKLAWSSHNEPLYGDKKIPSNQNIVVDVISTIKSEDRIIFTTQDTRALYKDKAYKGKYLVRVRVTGIFSNKRFEKKVEFNISYEGNMKLEHENST